MISHLADIAPEITGNVSVFTLVNSVVILITVVITIWTSRNTKRIRTQVENNHVDSKGKPINLREEGDERHSENANKLDKILTGQDSIKKTQLSQGKTLKMVVNRVSLLTDRSMKHDDQIDELEHTIPKPIVVRRRK